ncbi:p24 family protein alpha [Pelomyxa schiedti]|nr:p24 family protein alpha [Pelomyxa schiedti]
MWAIRVVVVAVVLSAMPSLVTCGWRGSAFVTYSSNSHKCFLEDLASATELRARYSLHHSSHLQFDEGQRLAIRHHGDNSFESRNLTGDQDLGAYVVSSVQDPLGNLVHEVPNGDSDGEVLYTTKMAGQHKICFSVKKVDKQMWFSSKTYNSQQSYKLFVEILTGVDARDYKPKLGDNAAQLETHVLRANDLVAQVRAEQTLAKERGAKFYAVSDTTRRRLLVWVVVQALILLGCCAWQTWSLHNFLKAKKAF